MGIQLLIIFVLDFLNFPSLAHLQYGPRVKREISNSIVVNMAVVCDKAFSDKLQQNRQKIIDYLAVWVYDTNMSFKTLRTVDISFRVTSLMLIQNERDQPFIRAVMFNNGSLLPSNLLQEFSKWVYTKKDEFNNINIFVLLTGVKSISDSTWSIFVKGACKKHTTTKMYESSLVLSKYFTSWSKKHTSLQKLLALWLGSTWDSDSNDPVNCKEGKYIMSDELIGENKFFSECSNIAIANYINSENGSCLRNTEKSGDDVLLTWSRVRHPPSIQEQCEFFKNNTNAIAVYQQTESACKGINCYINSNGILKSVERLYPLENSPCGSSKFCFWGRCIPEGYLIQNIVYEKCLHSTNRFSNSDLLIITDCPLNPNPLDQFMILGENETGRILATPYAIPSLDVNEDKCLSVSLNGNVLQYRQCSLDDSENISWDFIRAGDKGEFLLFHRQSKTCAKAESDFKVTMDATCNSVDLKMLWKFTNPNAIPQGWYKDEDSLKQKTEVENNIQSSPLSILTEEKSNDIVYTREEKITRSLRFNPLSLMNGDLHSYTIKIPSLKFKFSADND